MANQQTGWQTSEVVRLLERLELAPLNELEQRVLLERAELNAQVKWPNLSAPYCAFCGIEQVSATDATAHVLRCERHPARIQYQRLSRVAARLSEQRGVPNDLEPAPALTFPSRSRDEDFWMFVPFAEAVALLGRDGVSADKRQEAARSVRGALRSTMNIVERAIDPCPWCAGIFPLETFREHLWGCEQHPGAHRSFVLADALKDRFGEVAVNEAIAEDRELQAKATLETFIRACRVYAENMGYSGDGTYYSKVWDEKPWNRARSLADAFARDERKEPMPPRLARLVLAIATITDQSLRFWNGMSDGERGKSIIDADDSRAWDEQVNVAELALKT